jgi:hypothetical protein
VITIWQAVVSGFVAGVLFAAFAFALGAVLGRRVTLAEMAGPAHNPRLDRWEAGWLAAREPTTYQPQLAAEEVPEFLLWDQERGDRG